MEMCMSGVKGKMFLPSPSTAAELSASEGRHTHKHTHTHTRTHSARLSPSLLWPLTDRGDTPPIIDGKTLANNRFKKRYVCLSVGLYSKFALFN